HYESLCSSSRWRNNSFLHVDYARVASQHTRHSPFNGRRVALDVHRGLCTRASTVVARGLYLLATSTSSDYARSIVALDASFEVFRPPVDAIRLRRWGPAVGHCIACIKFIFRCKTIICYRVPPSVTVAFSFSSWPAKPSRQSRPLKAPYQPVYLNA